MKRFLRGLDWVLIGQVTAISLIGVLAVFSATYRVGELHPIWLRQLFWLFVAFGGMLTVARVDYRLWLELAYPLYMLSVFFLILVLLVGDPTKGAQRWLRFGPISFQPSEFAKMAMILVLARFLGSRSVEVYFLGNLVRALALLAPPLFLILKQPDMGSALLLIPLSVVLLYVVGVPGRWLAYLFLLGAASSPLVWHFLRDYQRKRFEAFLNPQADPLGAGYNIIQSIIAIGSGGVAGKGFLQGSQTQLSFIPEHHTDFIFSVVGEEWGFLGSALLLGLYLAFLTRCFRIALRGRDREGMLLAGGITVLFTVQVLVNVGMVVGLLPVTGITLPFVSYGGSSLFYSWCAVGVLLNVAYAARRPVLLSRMARHSPSG